GDDTFTSWQGRAWMTGTGYINHATGFRTVVGVADGGNDRAVVRDGTGNDVLSGSGDAGYLGRGTDAVRFIGFDAVTLIGVFGGINRRANGAFAFQLAVTGGWW
ncbi:MAG: hypothetical protein ACRC33_27885, partial [Gemmataceae bacterium]